MSERNEKHAKDFHELSGEEGMRKIAELVKGIRICMMSTVDELGQVQSRPMATQEETEFDGTVWFLTRSTSGKVQNINEHERVSLDYAEPKDSKYITLRGRARVSRDQRKIDELWNPMYKAWFPEGKEDPEIAVVRVDVSEGDYWEASSSKFILGIRYVAAAVTGGKVPVGESGHVAVE
jgi:general stress protein 26